MKFNLKVLFISLLFVMLNSCSISKKKRFIEINKDSRILSPVLHYTVGDPGIKDLYTYHIVVDYDSKDTLIVILPNNNRRFKSYSHRVYSPYNGPDEKSVKREVLKHQQALEEFPYKWTVGRLTFNPHYFGKGSFNTNPFGTYKILDTARECELVFTNPNCFVIKNSNAEHLESGYGVYIVKDDSISFYYGSNQSEIGIVEKDFAVEKSNVFLDVKNHFGRPANPFVVTLIQKDTTVANRSFVFNKPGEYLDFVDGEKYQSMVINNMFSSVSIDISTISDSLTYEINCTLLETNPGLAKQTRKYDIDIPDTDEMTLFFENDSLTFFHFW